MKVFKYIIAFAMLLSCIQVSAGQSAYAGGIRFELPDSYTQQKNNNGQFEAVEKGTGNFIIVSYLSLEKYDKSKLYASMDTIMYTIPTSEYELQGTETEWFFQWNKDYVKRYYKYKGEDESKVLTYTFCTDNKCYCLLYSYKTEADLVLMNDIISSMNLGMDFVDSLRYLYGCAPFYWIFYGLVILIMGMVAWEGGFKAYMVFIPVAMLILLATLWGDWLNYFIASAITLTVMALSPVIIFVLSLFDD